MKLMIADIDTDRMKVNVATFPGIGMMADWRGKASSMIAKTTRYAEKYMEASASRLDPRIMISMPGPASRKYCRPASAPAISA